ncbi:hypothetical protein Afil01_46890 [Actinorhabdospora filicis]|uniref:Alpha/beta hydrolase n=2 Tax=Actinorhabdospora filicis TaxID=1785913 RepID=A0A9W6W516_9ACTN|nr:hypothetical protein Afil01_46890 [Actinorhabdospora filicis]
MGLARDLGVCAEQIATTAARLTALLSDPVLLRSVAASPRTGAKVTARLGRAIAGGLGCGTETNRLGKVIAMLTSATGRESLPALVAASALKTRVRALTKLHPELREDADLAALIAAIEGDRQVEAVRRFRRLMKERGTQQALGAIAPVFIELSGLIALLDENPFNDAVGWNFAVGKPPTGEPLLGVSMTWVSAFEKGEGSAIPVGLPPEVSLDDTGTIAGHMRNIGVLRPYGYMLLQRVRAGDGAERWLLVLPGMTSDTVSSDSTQDLVGAIRNTQLTESTYTRALRTTFAAAGVPDGAEIALIGHSQGGVVAMNIVSDAELVERYRFTHLVAVGSPVDYKKPLVADLWVASVTNQHDIVPALDGRGFGAVHNPHPDWYEVDFADGRHGFPACHGAKRYAENLAEDIPEAAAHIDRKLTGYRGEVLGTAAFRLSDK